MQASLPAPAHNNSLSESPNEMVFTEPCLCVSAAVGAPRLAVPCSQLRPKSLYPGQAINSPLHSASAPHQAARLFCRLVLNDIISYNSLLFIVLVFSPPWFFQIAGFAKKTARGCKQVLLPAQQQSVEVTLSLQADLSAWPASLFHFCVRK